MCLRLQWQLMTLQRTWCDYRQNRLGGTAHKNTIRLVGGLRAQRFGLRSRMWSQPCLIAAKRASIIGSNSRSVKIYGKSFFDAFADEFTDIVGFYALRDAFPEHIGPLGTWARSRQGRERPLEALGEI